jgi:tetratricopeptide (TPR) repeat protein
MDKISLEDLDEVDLLLTELEISKGRGNLVLCIIASRAYREKVIEAVKTRFPTRILPVEKGDNLILDLRNIKPKAEEILIWTLPEMLAQDVLDALNNFRELFYDAGVPSLVFMTPAGLDDVIWKAPDFWRYRGGYHILKGKERGPAFQAVEALSVPFSFSYRNKEDLLRRKRINEYLQEKIQNKSEKEKILLEIGTVHFFLGEPRKAIEYYEQALAIARQIEDKRIEESALGSLGNSHFDLGDIRKAIEFHEQALAIARDIGDRRGEGADLGNLGLAYAALGDTKKAIDYYEQHLAIARDIGDRRGEGADLGNLGNAYAALGDTKKSIDYYEQHLAIAREIGDRRGVGNALGNLGNAYAALGDTKRAIDYYEQHLAIAREIGDRRGEGNALGNLGNAYAALGDAHQAIEYMKAAVAILEQIESPYAMQARKKLAEWQGNDSQNQNPKTKPS